MLKGIQKKIAIIILGVLLLQTLSCKKSAFDDQKQNPAQVYFNQSSGIYPAPATSFIQDVEKISIPVELTLSVPASATFTVNLTGNLEVANKAIASQALTNTLAISPTLFTLPATAEVRFGVNKVIFTIDVSKSLIERNYGKKIALGLRISDATKGNAILDSKKDLAVIINTAEVISANDLHNISFKNGGIFNINAADITKDLVTVNIPLQIDMGGSVGKAFGMKLVSNPDTLQKMIANGILSNTRIIDESSITAPQTATIGLNLNSTSLTLSIKLEDLLKNYGSKWAYALTIKDPEKYQVLESKKTVIVVINPLTILDEITPLLKNTTQPFIASTLDPVGKRWGKLADWTTNDAVNVFKGVISYGSYDANNSTNIAIEAFSPDRPNITNGKIYQTISLPAGDYRFNINLRSGSNNGKAFAMAVAGTNLPDVDPTTINSLGFVKLTATAGAYSVAFKLTAQTTVTLGFGATITQNNSFNINGVKLLRVL